MFPVAKCVFQSHHDSIINSPLADKTTRWNQVSIPPWFDYKQSCALFVNPKMIVSIPPWFDYKPAGGAVVKVKKSGFNPTMIRL